MLTYPRDAILSHMG